jgi:hypothetical protein
MTQMIKDNVAGVRARRKRDATVEGWLRTEGVARYDAYHADPSRGVSADRVWDDLRRHMKTPWTAPRSKI